MKSCREKITSIAPTVFLAVALASCGGGGGGGGGGSPGVTNQGIVTSVSPADYASDNKLIYDQITAVRVGTGSGLLAQNTFLDNAASSHANFLVNFLVNNNGASVSTYLTTSHGEIFGGHYEDSPLATGYTGASPQARATAAGYSGTVTELLTVGAASGTECIASLENSMYHLFGLVSPAIDVGISFNAGNGSGSACVIVLGVKSTTLGQLPAAGNLVFYPSDAQSGVPPAFYNQAEMPVPASDLSSVGHPVVVSLYTLATPTLSGSDIVINTFTITPTGGGSALSARVLTNSGVGGTGLTVDNVIPAPGFVVLLPTAPLAASTTYDVSFNATVKGQTVSKTWSFTTGAAN